MPIAAPADKRFRRAQVSPSRQRSRWAVNWRTVARAAAILAIGGFVVYRAASLVLFAEALRVRRITVSGNERLARGEVVTLLEGLRGEHMLMVDLESWRQKLLTSPWVADAAMRRVLPGTVAVAIAERRPMAVGRISGNLYLIDDRGSIIDEFGPNYAEFDLPVIDGLGATPREGGPMVDAMRAMLAVRLLAAVQTRADLIARISQIDVSDQRNAIVLLKDDTALVRLGDDQFAERLQTYIELAPTVRQRMANIDYVDMRFDERIYVRPQGPGLRPAGCAKPQRGGCPGRP
jgi:cell division protein FtsQ